MTSPRSITLHTPDPGAADAFHAKAFDLGPDSGIRTAEGGAGSGFRGFTVSIVVGRPSTVDSLVGTALEAGATEVKPVSKSFWGYGGSVRAPDGTIWTLASSSKKDKGPETREIDELVLQLGVADVKATKQLYVDHGLPVEKSYGGKYVRFATGDSPLTLAVLPRRLLAKNAGVDEAGSGSHGITIRYDGEPFVDPDGYVWETT